MGIGSGSKKSIYHSSLSQRLPYRSPKTQKNIGARKPISSLERGVILVSIKKITEEGINDNDEAAPAYSGTAVAVDSFRYETEPFVRSKTIDKKEF